jgi:hypothetical protein
MIENSLSPLATSPSKTVVDGVLDLISSGYAAAAFCFPRRDPGNLRLSGK